MPEIVTIPKAQFEYAAVFEQPIIALWLNRALMVQAVFDALAPWGMDVSNVEGRNEGKVVDQGFAFRLPDHNATLFFGPSQFTFTHGYPDWGQVDEIIRMIDTALRAILMSSGASVKVQKATVALHMQPKTLHFRDLISKLWPAELLQLHGSAARTGAVIIRWEDAGITIDGSGLIKNGLFLRLERTFGSEVGFQTIAETLRDDELKALEILQVEVEEP